MVSGILRPNYRCDFTEVKRMDTVSANMVFSPTKILCYTIQQKMIYILKIRCVLVYYILYQTFFEIRKITQRKVLLS